MHPGAEGNFRDLDRVYLDTASYGIPPTRTVDALEAALQAWAGAEADWIADWDGAGDRCRSLVAPFVGAPASEVALEPAVSVGAAIALAGLPPGAEILAPEDEFASILLPALAAAERVDGRVRRVAFEALADEVDGRTALVISSHARSNDGRVQDLAALGEAAGRVGATTLIDATHSLGILPVDAEANGICFVVAAAYKHLLCPRGVAFLRVPHDRFAATPAIAGSWRAAKTHYDYYYGPALDDLAPDAARYDVSLAWHAWVGAEQSIEFLGSVSASERRDWCVGLADALTAELGIARSGSSVIAVPVSNAASARADLRDSGIVCSGRGQTLRLSFHLYNDYDDVVSAAAVLHKHVCPEAP